MNRLLIRKFHRWLGIFAAIQFLAWTVSGFYFTLIPIEEIRGNHLLKPKPQVAMSEIDVISPTELIKTHSTLGEVTLDEISLGQRLGQVVYLIQLDETTQVFDATSGRRLNALTRDEALQLAERRAMVAPLDAKLITAVTPGHEYRSGPLPAWQVRLANDANIYIAADSGVTRAVRTNEWRIFDLLWSLHIMDYDERDDFNHWLLKLAALLAIITVLSGVVLFIVSTRWRKPAILERR